MFRPPSLRARLLRTYARPSGALIGAWLLALAAPAAAQSETDPTTTPTNASSAGNLRVRPISVGDEEVKLGEIFVGIEACDQNATILFEIDGVPSNKPSVDLYTGENCTAASSRDDDSTSECDLITNIKVDQADRMRIELTAKQLIGECGMPQESTPKLWFLAVKTTGSSEDVGMDYAMIETLTLDTRRPEAPTSVSGGSGEKQIPVSWSASESDLNGFVVLIDTNPTDGSGGPSGSSGASGEPMDSGAAADDDEDGGTAPAPATGGGRSDDGECGSSVLTPTGLADDLPSSIKRKTTSKATATSLDLSPEDIGGDSAAVAVIAIDEAGNESPISEIACVKVVPTTSFWDEYQASSGAVDAGCPCAALGPAHLESAWPIALSLSLVALSARRRRRS